MKISQRGQIFGGGVVQATELEPEHLSMRARVGFGLIGVLMVVGSAIVIAVTREADSDRYLARLLPIFGLGLMMICFALGRLVYWVFPRREVRMGWVLFGFKLWLRKVPLTEDLSYTAMANEEGELFVELLRPNGMKVLGIGACRDLEEAKLISEMLKRREMFQSEHEEAQKIDQQELIEEVRGGSRPSLLRIYVFSWFLFSLVPVALGRDWESARISLIFSIVLLPLAICFLAPSSGVFRGSADRENIILWWRHRFFQRLEYRKSLVSTDPAEYIRTKFHFASVGWVLLVPLNMMMIWALYSSPEESSGSDVIDFTEELRSRENDPNHRRGIEVLEEAVRRREVEKEAKE